MEHFTEEELRHLTAIKFRIVEKFADMVTQPWWDGGLVVDWSQFYLSGGAIASLIQDESPKDWDIYNSSPQDADLVVEMVKKKTEYIADVDPKYTEVMGVDGKMITANAITMKDGTSFITMCGGLPAEVKKTFDYVHCTPHYDLVNKTLWISPHQYHAARYKKLIVNNPDSIRQYRLDKFLKRGYTKL